LAKAVEAQAPINWQGVIESPVVQIALSEWVKESSADIDLRVCEEWLDMAGGGSRFVAWPCTDI
jgi:hypothetical protein